MQAPELVATQYVSAGDLPKIPGWNRATNQQVAKTLKQTLYYRKAGGASIATIANMEGKNIPGVQLEQKIADPSFQRFARTSTNIGSNLQNVDLEEILCLNGFYREAISESQVENERIRLVKVKYFRKDGTIEIS